jgi:hypothetical protein
MAQRANKLILSWRSFDATEPLRSRADFPVNKVAILGLPIEIDLVAISR